MDLIFYRCHCSLKAPNLKSGESCTLELSHLLWSGFVDLTDVKDALLTTPPELRSQICPRAQCERACRNGKNIGWAWRRHDEGNQADCQNRGHVQPEEAHHQ